MPFLTATVGANESDGDSEGAPDGYNYRVNIIVHVRCK